jgi:hypothetical protein
MAHALQKNPLHEAPHQPTIRSAPAGEVTVDLRIPAWHEHAMCKGKTAIFFATPGERDGRRNRREALARAYCACCTVAVECRAAGREGREHGMWGGENDEQRAAAGFGARSPHRRAVAAAARQARVAADDRALEHAIDADADADVA